MKNLVIVGAGGMGRTVYDIVCESRGYGMEYNVKGFIDDDLSALDGFTGYPPLLGTVSDYLPAPDDVFTFPLAGVHERNAYRRCWSAKQNLLILFIVRLVLERE